MAGARSDLPRGPGQRGRRRGDLWAASPGQGTPRQEIPRSRRRRLLATSAVTLFEPFRHALYFRSGRRTGRGEPL